MFSGEERTAVRQRLVDHARRDPQVTGCAFLGSTARGEEDTWSDIDLAVQLADDVVLEDVAARWTEWLRGVVEVADSLDVQAFGALYRVFLLRSSLQVDLSFWPHGMFRSVGGGPVHLVFGELNAPEPRAVPDAVDLARNGWLYALHARSAIARGRSWQAEMMLTDLRTQIIALACLRHGLDPAQGRHAHELPDDLSATLWASRASGPGAAEQQRSLRGTLDLYRQEVAHHDPRIATSLKDPLDALATEHHCGEPSAP